MNKEIRRLVELAGLERDLGLRSADPEATQDNERHYQSLIQNVQDGLKELAMWPYVEPHDHNAQEWRKLSLMADHIAGEESLNEVDKPGANLSSSGIAANAKWNVNFHVEMLGDILFRAKEMLELLEKNDNESGANEIWSDLHADAEKIFRVVERRHTYGDFSYLDYGGE